MSSPQQVAKAIVENIEEAHAWLERYPLDKTVGDIPMEAWKQAFELETGSIVEVHETYDTDMIGRKADGSWAVGLKLDDHWSAGIHEKGHMRWSPFDEVTKAGEAVATQMNRPEIANLTNVIEDVRIENMCDYWWPAVEVGANHRAALLRAMIERSYTFEGGGPNRVMHPSAPYIIPNGDGRPQTLCNALLYYLYDIPNLCLDPIANDVIDRFGKELRATVKDPGGYMGIGSKLASVKLAIKIAKYLRWRETQSDKPQGGDQQGGDDGQSGGSATPSDDKSEDDSEGAGGHGGDEPPLDSPQDEKDIDDLLDAVDKEVGRDVRTIVNADKRRQKLDVRGAAGNLSSDHPWMRVDVPQDAPPLHHKLRSMLDSYTEPIAPVKVARHGRFDGRKITKLQQGNTNVFTARHRTRGPVIIMVDGSSSMGCHCDRHFQPSGYHAKPGERIAVEDRLNRAGAAWQLARSIARAVGDAEVYAFTANARPTTIAPIKHDMQARCMMDGLNGGTPLCSAMVWLANRVKDSQHATVLFITDGAGAGCPAGVTEPPSHTYQVASQMHNSGVDFIAIQLGDFADSFPSDILIKIPTYGGGYIDANDLASVGVAIKHIRENR